jgi:hypothetical protein
MRCGYEGSRIILLQANLYNYSLLRGVTSKVLELSSYALSSMVLPLIETFLELLLWNSSQCCRIFLDVFSTLKSSSLQGRLYFWKQPEVIQNQIMEESGCYISVIDFGPETALERAPCELQHCHGGESNHWEKFTPFPRFFV